MTDIDPKQFKNVERWKKDLLQREAIKKVFDKAVKIFEKWGIKLE